MKWKNPRNLILIIIALSFILSISYSFWHRIEPVVDADAYDNIAINLTQGNGFKEEALKSYEFDTAIVRAGPGYEFFLAGIYKIFGHHYGVVWIFQAILHAVCAWLLFLIARQVFKKYEFRDFIGLIAAGLFGFHPDLIEIGAMLMTETLYLFFIILMLYLFVKIFENVKNYKLAALLGLTTGIAILTRPPVVLFVPIFLFFYWRKSAYRCLIAFTIILILSLLPWVVRNYLIYNQFILTTLIGEYNLWVGNILSATGGQITGGYNPLTEYTSVEGFFDLKEKAYFEFFNIVTHHPLHFLKLSLIRLVRYFSLIRPMGFWFYQTGINQAIFVSSSLIGIAVLFVAGFSGMIYSLKQKNTILYYFIILAMTAPLLLIPTVVQSRYRFQIYPFLAIFGGYAIACWICKRGWWKEKIFWIPTAGLLFVTLIDVLLNINVIMERLSLLLG